MGGKMVEREGGSVGRMEKCGAEGRKVERKGGKCEVKGWKGGEKGGREGRGGGSTGRSKKKFIGFWGGLWYTVRIGNEQCGKRQSPSRVVLAHKRLGDCLLP